MARNEIKGMKELERSIKQLGKLPQKCVTKAAKSGASIALKEARADAPEDTGDLKKGIILKGERRTKAGKKVYQVTLDSRMNDIFAKKHKAGRNHSSVRDRKAKVGSDARSYYPASMEFGYFAKNGRYIPGFHYLKDSIVLHAQEIEKKTVDVLSKEIDKELGKGR